MKRFLTVAALLCSLMLMSTTPGPGKGPCGDCGVPQRPGGTNMTVGNDLFDLPPLVRGNDCASRVDIPNSHDFLGNFITLP